MQPATAHVPRGQPPAPARLLMLWRKSCLGTEWQLIHGQDRILLLTPERYLMPLLVFVLVLGCIP